MADKSILDRGGEEYRSLFRNYLAKGHKGLTDTEARALSEGSATGGAVLFPTTFSNTFMGEIGDDAIVGAVSKVYGVTGTFNQPIITPSSAGGFSVQKNPGEAGTLIDATASGQTTVTVPTLTNPGTSNTGTGTSTFTLKRISVMVRASQELVEDSAQMGDASVENLIVRQAAHDIKRELSRQILVGNKDDSVTSGTASTAGSDACHGIVNTLKRYSRLPTGTSVMGVSSATFSGGGTFLSATLGMIDGDRLHPIYWEKSTVIVNAQMTRSSAGSYGAPIFGSGTTPSTLLTMNPANLFGRPVILRDLSPAYLSGNVASPGTTGPQPGDALVLMVDLSKYLLAFAGNGISVTRVNETFAATNEAAFIVSVRCAGALIDVNAGYGIQRG